MTLQPSRICAALCALALAVLVGHLAWQLVGPHFASRPEEPPPAAIPLPPPVESEYVNTRPEVAYVGSAACVACHARNHQSYLLTPHSRALAEIDPDAEPPDGGFEHKLSGRAFRVYRKDGRLRHEETYRDAHGAVVAQADYPVRYVIGSGHFCRSYLIEVNGFLHESPITWYTGPSRYDMSPGYDFAAHWSFERPVTRGCVHCHSGGASSGGTVHKITFRALAVGCENCHGPGAKHIAHQRAAKTPPDEFDRTIVNPGKLSRSLAEAVCADCHQGSAATVRLRERGPDEFRPGMPRSNQRMDYRAAGVDGRMTVTGHLEQLRLSKCYTNSELTCITCHDLHARQRPADLAAHRRQQCLTCHGAEKCTAPAADRATTKPADSCVTCHMPRGDTDIPHLAFSHHRIGVHRAAPPPPTEAPILEPTTDDAQLSPADRKRNLALAYLNALKNRGYEAFAPQYTARAVPLLEEAYALGLRDPETTHWLARLTVKRDPRRAREFARFAATAIDGDPEMRAPAMMVLANGEFSEGKFDAAIERLRELVQLRRQADDWRFLGDCHLEAGDHRAALDAFSKAVAIRPFRAANHRGIAEAHRRLGNAAKAMAHDGIAAALQAGRQQ